MLDITEPTPETLAERRCKLVNDIHFKAKENLSRIISLKGTFAYEPDGPEVMFSPAGMICEFSKLGSWVDLHFELPGWWGTQFAYVISSDDTNLALKKAKLLAMPFDDVDLRIPEEVKQYYGITDRLISRLFSNDIDSEVYWTDGLIKVLIEEFELSEQGYYTDQGMYDSPEYDARDDKFPATPVWVSPIKRIHAYTTNKKGARVARCPRNWTCITCNRPDPELEPDYVEAYPDRNYFTGQIEHL